MNSEVKNDIEYIQQNDEFDYLKSLIDSLKKGKCIGILLYGPTGTGKTLLAISLAKFFKSSYYFVDGSPDLDRRDIEGNWEIIKGETKFNYGPLTQAINDANKSGISFVIINEINAIRENEQISLNSFLSENHINLISKGFEKYELNPESKLIVIGTMNKGVMGINKLQEAFEDRFIVCPEINYPIMEKEIEITTSISGCDKRIAEIVVDAAHQIREQAIMDLSITKIFSTRLIVNFCSLITKMPPKYLRNNIENIIINKLGENQEEKKSIAMILDGKMFESNLKEELKKLYCIENKNNFTADNNKNSNNEIINKIKSLVLSYFRKFGKSYAFKQDGNISWRVMEWFWKNHKEIFQNYIRLTEKLDYHKIYKENTGKNHIYRNQLTLNYIKWLYRNKLNELMVFMKKFYPIL